MTSNILHTMHDQALLTFADYGCDAYGTGTYANCSAVGPEGGLLANTGYDVLIPLAFALALLMAGGVLALKRWRRRRALR